MRLAVPMLAAAWTRHITAAAASAPLGAAGRKMDGPGDVFAAEEQLQWAAQEAAAAQAAAEGRGEREFSQPPGRADEREEWDVHLRQMWRARGSSLPPQGAGAGATGVEEMEGLEEGGGRRTA